MNKKELEENQRKYVADIRSSSVVKQEYVGKLHWVSTVKLPSAYDDMKLGKYETMITGYKGEWLDYTKRCDTWDQALVQHKEAKRYALALEECEKEADNYANLEGDEE